ncbi:MAG: hypothetical protein K1X72_25245 [Pyrinomonadaceae bacterium]|nr:hypothetical protein [Pyrinomonadaceae bacterium]
MKKSINRNAVLPAGKHRANDVNEWNQKSIHQRLEFFAPCAQCQLEAWRSIQI